MANNSGIPLWTLVQAGDSLDQVPDNDPLIEGELKWNANMGLAFGAQGIQYFTLVQPADAAYQQSVNGLIDSTGEETELYQWAKDVNKQIVAVDDILMNATNKGIMATGTYATSQVADKVKDITLYETSWNIFESGTDIGMTVYENNYEGATVTCDTDDTYGTLTGCFEYKVGEETKHALYIVNYNVEKENTVTVKFGSDVTVTMIHNGDTTKETVSSKDIQLGAGEAVLVVF